MSLLQSVVQNKDYFDAHHCYSQYHFHYHLQQQPSRNTKRVQRTSSLQLEHTTLNLGYDVQHYAAISSIACIMYCVVATRAPSAHRTF